MEQLQAGPLRQTRVCFERCLRAFVNDRGWKTFLSVALITVLIGMVMGGDTFKGYAATRNGAFALVCACIWIGIFNSIRTICRERDILRREHRTGLNLWSYMAAHWIYEALLSMAEAVVVMLIVRVMCYDHFVTRGVLLPPTLEMGVTFFLIIFSADALGLLISSIVHSENTAMTVMPFALIVQLVMSGTIFELSGLPDAISNLTISRWGLDAICATAHVNEMLEVGMGYVEALPEQAASASNLLALWGLLAFFAAVYGVLAAAFLHLVDRG